MKLHFFIGFFLSLTSTFVFASSPLADKQGRSIQLRHRPDPSRIEQCQLCHPRKKREFINKKLETKLEHTDKHSSHGRTAVACQSCHDLAKSNELLSEDASWQNSSPVCERCHADRYRDWLSGAHGKRTGSWNGPIVQLHCIDCHDPHSVKIKKVIAQPHSRPKLAIEKNEESNLDGVK